MIRLIVFSVFCGGCLFAENGAKIATSAKKQVGITLSYDPAYVSLAYPGGDIPRERGVCTDVVIRALRDALGADLQKLVHEDMKANFGRYPKIWGLKRPNKNIDHRRVPNLQAYFSRKHQSMKLPKKLAEGDFRPGDFVTCTVPPHLPHIMVVSEKKNGEGLPLVIHNIGGGAREEDRLGDFKLTGHYRWKE